MAGKAPSARVRPRRWRIGLATARFHEEITGSMRADARKRAQSLGVEIVAEAEVTGSYDLPFVVRELLRRKDVDAAVALGAIIEGETQHDEAIAHASFYALTQVALDEEKPVGLGVTGPGQTIQQAKARIDRAGAAVDAVVGQLEAVAGLSKR
jgi:6,7-dimethyl-8-ribityllumazine synthase